MLKFIIMRMQIKLVEILGEKMNEIKIGRCSLCGGSVVFDKVWMGTQPQIPYCKKCGATEKDTSPVVEMEKKDD